MRRSSALPKNTLLHPVAEPTRITQPASSSFGKRRRAALTVFCAAQSLVSRRGDADGEKVLTTAWPDLSILSNPAIDDIWVGPALSFWKTKKCGYASADVSKLSTSLRSMMVFNCPCDVNASRMALP